MKRNGINTNNYRDNMTKEDLLAHVKLYQEAVKQARDNYRKIHDSPNPDPKQILDAKTTYFEVLDELSATAYELEKLEKKENHVS